MLISMFGRRGSCAVLLRWVLACALCGVAATACSKTVKGPDELGIYVSNLAGETPRLVVASSWQQMTHPRVSPDREWITLTRYNKKNLAGYALERNGYQQTEILIVRVDGSDLQSQVRHYYVVRAVDSVNGVGQRLSLCVSATVLAGCGAMAVMFTHDGLLWNRLRWEAVRHLVTERRIAPEHIDGGLSVSGWYLFPKEGPLRKPLRGRGCVETALVAQRHGGVADRHHDTTPPESDDLRRRARRRTHT